MTKKKGNAKKLFPNYEGSICTKMLVFNAIFIAPESIASGLDSKIIRFFFIPSKFVFFHRVPFLDKIGED